MRMRGFTLIEIAIVFAIGGIILAIAIPAFDHYIERSRIAQTVIEIGDMSKTIKRREMSKGALPDMLSDAGLDDKRDPWGFPYEYHNQRSGTGNGTSRRDKKLKPLNSDFDLYSIGRDGMTHQSLGNSKSRDDIVRARDGGFIGTAEEFDP